MPRAVEVSEITTSGMRFVRFATTGGRARTPLDS